MVSVQCTYGIFFNGRVTALILARNSLNSKLKLLDKVSDSVSVIILRKCFLIAKKRLSETESEAMIRKESDRVTTAKKRYLESESETMIRKESNKVTMAIKRLSETESEAKIRKESNKVAKARRRL